MLSWFTAGICAGAAYCLYLPLPKGYEEPWKTRFILYIVGFFQVMMSAVNYIGCYEHPLGFFKFLSERSRKSGKRDASPGLKVSDNLFDGVPVRVYDPEGRTENSVAVVYFHGGGWTVGNIDLFDQPMQYYAMKTGVLFVSVDYRLAPEHVYPSAVDDCVAATKYLLNNAASFLVNPNRVAVAGDSSGGHLSAVVSLKLRDEAFPIQPAAQILIYPATQAMDFNTPSYNLYGSYRCLTKFQMIAFWSLFQKGTANRSNLNTLWYNKHVSQRVHSKFRSRCDPFSLIPTQYSGLTSCHTRRQSYSDAVDTTYESLFTDPYVSPLLADDLSKLPKTYIVTAEVDVLRDDGMMYATRLQQAGNDVTHRHYYSSFHGFISGPRARSNDLTVKKVAMKELIDYIQTNI